MQFKKTLVRLLIILLPAAAYSQTTYLPQGDKENVLLERLEIMGQTDSILNFSKIHPFSRKMAMDGIASYLKKNGAETLSWVDTHNLFSVYLNNQEWIADGNLGLYKSKKPVFKNFYKTPANLYEVHVKDFDLIVNPVIQYVVSKEKGNDQSLFLNTRGVVLRARIANKIGINTYMTDNQEREPLYVQQWIAERQAVPGNGFYKSFKAAGGVDYFDARGYITFNVAKYIDVAFGYDRNFIGNGYRSLFLSDFGAPTLFLKLNTRIWKFNYQNLFMELVPSYTPGGDKLIPKKYAAFHHLDIDITKSLNIGLFEGVMFGRKDRFEFGYLNPVIFYRSIEQQNGSFDNSVIGLDAKANIKKRVQLYGQLLIDEFLFSEIKRNRGWWGNKWGIQAGAKYIDAFNIKNLDLQVETNRVRPFTYSHGDSVANYTHYNQPLAHPLGANFQEFIGIARYQPASKWMIQAKAIYYKQGLDSSAANLGSNIFLPNAPPYRTADFGYKNGGGHLVQVLNASLLLSYELKENMFIEINALYRKYSFKTPPLSAGNTSVISFGFRWNMSRRNFDF
ncbi:MAG: hypothetical protein JSU05_07625 [Bacteroidetes bacterium]|nr:hypothetical protein [Bacteroidota bacterium]